MSKKTAEAYILSSLATGQFRYEDDHAAQRLSERNISIRDLMELGKNGIVSAPNEQGRYTVKGLDADGDDLKAIVVIEDEVVLITAM